MVPTVLEVLGHRAIYHAGWHADWRVVCPWPEPSFAEAGGPFGQPISSEALSKLNADGWELRQVAERAPLGRRGLRRAAEGSTRSPRAPTSRRRGGGGSRRGQARG